MNSMRPGNFPTVASILCLSAFAALLIGASAGSVHGAALGGPVVIGGDDLSRHGSRLGGANQGGWLYIEKAIAAIDAGVSASGPFTVDIAALGPFAVAGCPGACPDGEGDPGLGIGSVAQALGMTVSFYGDAPAILGFFDDLASGAVEPRIIWLAGCNLAKNALCTPDLNEESAVLLEHATALSGFVASGHGLMAHGAKNRTNPLLWLTSLLPDVSITYNQCESTGIGLTAEGMSVLPGLLDSDIDDTVSPCNNQFAIPSTGALRGLRVLALEGAGIEPDFSVCVGGADEGLSCPTASTCPGGACESGAMFMLGGGAGTLITGCGDDLVNQPGEECDGTADGACPGACLPPGDPLECRCNRCDVPLTGCKLPGPQKAQISIKDVVDDTRDKLKWKWTKGATSKTEFEDGFGNTPLMDSGPTYQFCVFADAVDAPTPIARAAVRSDAPQPTSCNLFSTKKPCWKEVTSGYKYANKDLTPFGVQKLDLKPGAVDKAKINLKGKGRVLELPAGAYPLTFPLKVQLSNGQTCWEANYSTFRRNESDPLTGTRRLNAKSD